MSAQVERTHCSAARRQQRALYLCIGHRVRTSRVRLMRCAQHILGNADCVTRLQDGKTFLGLREISAEIDRLAGPPGTE